MTPSGRLGGVWAAALTPLDASLRPDAGMAIPYYAELLRVCDGLNVLGTTGEAMSLSARQRLAFMEALANGGLDTARMMVGTGASSLDDAAELTRAAFSYGFAAALVIPPFYYRDASDDGIVRFFSELFERSHPPNAGVLLYNFPAMSGCTFHPGLVERLLAVFPETIAGMKDSSNDSALQAGVLRGVPRLRVFAGSERALATAKAAGVAGCISASVCLWPQLAREVFDTGDAGRTAALDARRQALSQTPIVASVRYAVGKERGDSSWERTLPPLLPLDGRQRNALDEALRSASAL